MDPYDYYQTKTKSERREEKKKREKKFYPETESDRIQSEIEIKETKDKRASEAESAIVKHILGFPDPKTPEGERQIKIYIRWTKDSINHGSPILDDGDLKTETFLPSVHAGGQNAQKNQTGVRVRHIPTHIFVEDDEERVQWENKEKAKEHLTKRLDEHLALWRTLIENSSKAINIEGKVLEIANNESQAQSI